MTERPAHQTDTPDEIEERYRAEAAGDGALDGRTPSQQKEDAESIIPDVTDTSKRPLPEVPSREALEVAPTTEPSTGDMVI